MTQDESMILSFLQSAPESAFSRKEIARKAVKRSVYDENRQWADQPLQTLVARGQVVIDDSGLYRIKRSSVF